MANTCVTLKVMWSWDGDVNDIMWYNVAITETNEDPNNTTTTVAISGKHNTEHTFKNILLDSDRTYQAWVQAVYIGVDSEWVGLGGITIDDDGRSSFQTQRDVEDYVNTNAVLSDGTNSPDMLRNDKITSDNVYSATNIDVPAPLNITVSIL